MVINLEFNRPLLVSQGDKPDQLVIRMNFSRFKDVNGVALPDYDVKIKDMPLQVGSKAEA